MSLLATAKKEKIWQMKVVEYFEPRPHKAVSFVVERGKERQEWSKQKLPKVLPGGRSLPGRSTKEKGREEGEVHEGGEERRLKDQIVEEVVAGIQEKVVDEGVKNNVKRLGGQCLVRSWDCSRIENEEEEERNAAKKGIRWQRSGMKSKNWRRF